MAIYFRLLLVLPLFFALLSKVIPGSEHIAVLSYSSLLFYVTGLPYILFALAAFAWSIIRASAKYSYAILFSPFVFGLFVFTDQLMLDFLSDTRSGPLLSDIGDWVLLSGIATVVSALYAWPALVFWHLLQLVRRTPAA